MSVDSIDAELELFHVSCRRGSMSGLQSIDEITPIGNTSIDSEEKESMFNSGLFKVENILWEGEIFENIQSLRHFKDSKSFVDHVLKTGDLFLVKDHFSQHILNYARNQSLKGTMKNLKMSKSFGSANQLKQQHCLVTDNQDNIHENQISKISSFPRLHSMTDKYQSVMDEFMNCFFFKPGFELLAGQTPNDWSENPKSELFTKILIPKNNKDKNTKLLSIFAHELNSLWKILYRKINKNVSENPYRYSLIPLKHNELFVSGGRFREIYYWDSFWIIQGLLCCGMVESSIKIVENLVDLVDRFGFVPNGTRKYYLTRSQPPLLVLMANEVYNVTKDKQWLKSILPLLIKEYKYWTNEPDQIAIVCDKNMNKQYKFSRYFSDNATPRPESYYEDRMTALLEDNEDLRADIYRNIRAAAASGWDFSSRWYYNENGPYGSTQNEILNLENETSDLATSVDEEMFDEFSKHRIQFTKEFSMTKLDTCNVIPVDLNIFLSKVEGCLSMFYTEIGDKGKADEFKKFQNTRIDGMLALLWDETDKQFRDWNFRYKCFGNLNMASNFSPLWLECEHKEFNDKQELLVESLSKSNLICGGGIVTTLYETGEQWDYPNCWSPLNSIIIEGLHNMGKTDYALKLANIWLNNNYHTFLANKKMHEKYHCEYYGTGGGGEYMPQFGFGWTNGVCLKLMELFGPEINLK